MEDGMGMGLMRPEMGTRWDEMGWMDGTGMGRGWMGDGDWIEDGMGMEWKMEWNGIGRFMIRRQLIRSGCLDREVEPDRY